MQLYEVTKYVLNRITELRLSREGLTESQLSRELGHKGKYLRTMNAEQKMVSFPTLLKVCDYFQITLEDFFSEAYKGSASAEYITRRIEEIVDEEDMFEVLKIQETLDKEDVKALLKIHNKKGEIHE